MCDKIAHTVPPNQFGQTELPQALITLMTLFHHSQFHLSMLMEVGQLIPYTFPSWSKNCDPSPLRVQKITE